MHYYAGTICVKLTHEKLDIFWMILDNPDEPDPADPILYRLAAIPGSTSAVELPQGVHNTYSEMYVEEINRRRFRQCRSNYRDLLCPSGQGF